MTEFSRTQFRNVVVQMLDSNSFSLFAFILGNVSISLLAKPLLVDRVSQFGFCISFISARFCFTIQIFFGSFLQMRARRLRRLGLIGGATESSQPAECTMADATESVEESNVVKSMADVSSSVDSDDKSASSDHRQKQLKFDNDAAMQQDSGGLNNNESAATSSTNQQRSRLLDEIERQRIENTINQNIESATETTAQKMETDENVQSSVDQPANEADSGIENMETDDVTTSVVAPVAGNVDVEVDTTVKQHEIEICLSRILDAFWSEQCEGQIIVSETADSYKDFIDADTTSINFEDLSFQIITEIITQYFDGKRVDFKNSHTSTPVHVKSRRKPNATSDSDANRMDTGESSCATPKLAPHNLPEHGACTYLMQAYQRGCAEYERYSSAKNQKRFGTTVLTMIFGVKEQLIRSAVQLLNGVFATRSGSKSYRSVLLDMLYDEIIPFDFLRHLVEEANRNGNNIGKTFGLLLNNLFTDMQSRVVGKKIDVAPINVLSQLLDITVTVAGVTQRPFCNLVAKLYNFYPRLCTDTPGREIVKVSYLGPFQSLSVFSEENPKLFEDVDEDWESNLGITLQTVNEMRKFEYQTV